MAKKRKNRSDRLVLPLQPSDVTRDNVHAFIEKQMEEEDVRRRERDESPEIKSIVDENNRRSHLPSEDPEHICGIFCDGQDGQSSMCWRVRDKLGYYHPKNHEAIEKHVEAKRRKREARLRAQQR